jgi:hypothetical protein
MSNIIDLASRRLRGPWVEVKCRHCGHAWELERKGVIEDARCAECGQLGGQAPADVMDELWICECGFHEFIVLRSGVIECTGCGMAAPFRVMALTA